MKKEEKLNQFWKYVLLIVGGILILVPLDPVEWKDEQYGQQEQDNR